MKSIRKFAPIFFALALLFISFAVVRMSVMAAPAGSARLIVMPPDPLGVILKVVTAVATMTGLGSLFAILINFGKAFGWVNDGNATQWMSGLSLLAVLVLVILAFLKPEWDLDFIDAQVGIIANILSVVLGLVSSLLAGWVTHFAFSTYRIPFFGASYSRNVKTRAMANK